MSRINPILEGSVKYRYGKKWKKRFCVLGKISRLSDSVELYILKDLDDYHQLLNLLSQDAGAAIEADEDTLTEANSSRGGAGSGGGLSSPYLYETPRPLDDIFGLESGRHVDKESNVIVLVGRQSVHCIALHNIEDMFLWKDRLQDNLIDSQFHVTLKRSVDSRRLHTGLQGSLHVQKSRICLIGEPSEGNKFICAWSFVDLKIDQVEADDMLILDASRNAGKVRGHYEFQVDGSCLSSLMAAIKSPGSCSQHSQVLGVLPDSSSGNSSATSGVCLAGDSSSGGEHSVGNRFFSRGGTVSPSTTKEIPDASWKEVSRSSEISIPRPRHNSSPDRLSALPTTPSSCSSATQTNFHRRHHHLCVHSQTQVAVPLSQVPTSGSRSGTVSVGLAGVVDGPSTAPCCVSRGDTQLIFADDEDLAIGPSPRVEPGPVEVSQADPRTGIASAIDMMSPSASSSSSCSGVSNLEGPDITVFSDVSSQNSFSPLVNSLPPHTSESHFPLPILYHDRTCTGIARSHSFTNSQSVAIGSTQTPYFSAALPGSGFSLQPSGDAQTSDRPVRDFIQKMFQRSRSRSQDGTGMSGSQWEIWLALRGGRDKSKLRGRPEMAKGSSETAGQSNASSRCRLPNKCLSEDSYPLESCPASTGCPVSSSARASAGSHSISPPSPSSTPASGPAVTSADMGPITSPLSPIKEDHVKGSTTGEAEMCSCLQTQSSSSASCVSSDKTQHQLSVRRVRSTSHTTEVYPDQSRILLPQFSTPYVSTHHSSSASGGSLGRPSSTRHVSPQTSCSTSLSLSASVSCTSSLPPHQATSSGGSSGASSSSWCHNYQQLMTTSGPPFAQSEADSTGPLTKEHQRKTSESASEVQRRYSHTSMLSSSVAPPTRHRVSVDNTTSQVPPQHNYHRHTTVAPLTATQRQAMEPRAYVNVSVQPSKNYSRSTSTTLCPQSNYVNLDISPSNNNNSTVAESPLSTSCDTASKSSSGQLSTTSSQPPEVSNPNMNYAMVDLRPSNSYRLAGRCPSCIETSGYNTLSSGVSSRSFSIRSSLDIGGSQQLTPQPQDPSSVSPPNLNYVKVIPGMPTAGAPPSSLVGLSASELSRPSSASYYNVNFPGPSTAAPSVLVPPNEISSPVEYTHIDFEQTMALREMREDLDSCDSASQSAKPSRTASMRKSLTRSIRSIGRKKSEQPVSTS